MCSGRRARTNSCLTLAVQYAGREITTIEGITGAAAAIAIAVHHATGRRVRDLPITLDKLL
ncbi:hypothetical protein GCM10023075_28530 [Streptosporangium album]